jgi:PAS domain S-box-containing protein
MKKNKPASSENEKKNGNKKQIPDSEPAEEESQRELIEMRNRIAELEKIEREQKQMETMLGKAQERFRKLVSQTPAVLYICQPIPPYARTYITENAKEQLGYEPQEFMQKPFFWFEHLHPQDSQRVHTEIPKLFTQSLLTSEYRFRQKNATYRWIQDAAKLARDAEGNPVAVYGYMIDITDRKQVEEEIKRLNLELETRVLERTIQLEAANQKLKQEIAESNQNTSKIRLLNDVVQSIDDCISLTDIQHNFIFVNAAFQKKYGFSKSELIGQNITVLQEYFDPYSQNRSIPQETIDKGSWEGEVWNKKKDGTVFPISLKTALIKDEQNQPVALIGIARDITDRKQAEKAM